MRPNDRHDGIQQYLYDIGMGPLALAESHLRQAIAKKLTERRFEKAWPWVVRAKCAEDARDVLLKHGMRTVGPALFELATTYYAERQSAFEALIARYPNVQKPDGYRLHSAEHMVLILEGRDVAHAWLIDGEWQVEVITPTPGTEARRP